MTLVAGIGLIAWAAPFGLAPLSGSSASVGVAGYTLGGGFGWLSRRYGLAADSLLQAGQCLGRLAAPRARHEVRRGKGAETQPAVRAADVSHSRSFS